MPSYDYGKGQVCEWIRANFPPASTILDVGACDGKWRELLPEYTMDAVEIFQPYADRLKWEIKQPYRFVYNVDIADFHFVHYDLILFGDVIEHMDVEKAQKVLRYASQRCDDLVVSVPFQYKQGIEDGNIWQVHIQDDLTPELVAERYPGLVTLIDTGRQYRYYHKGAR